MMIFMKIMQFILRVLTLAVFLCPFGLQAAEKEGSSPNKISHQGFLKHLDIPLYDGFKELKEESVLFDSEFGRLIETKAEGTAYINKVMSFYSLILPKLGWKLDLAEASCNKQRCTQKWRRDKEELRLVILAKEKASMTGKSGLVVSYSLKPIQKLNDALSIE
jgi:hypothetical protein